MRRALEVRSTTASPFLADQTTSRIVAELEKNVRIKKRFTISVLGNGLCMLRPCTTCSLLSFSNQLKLMSMMNSISSNVVPVLMQVSELFLCRMYAFR